jgi:glycosyltransferase 2 family protein
LLDKNLPLPPGEGLGVRGIRNFAIYFFLVVLLWWALRNVPLGEIWITLRQLRLWQITLLLSLNMLVIILITARWWIIVRAENRRIPFLPLTGYRLSAFGLSYFTPGPQVGGEPLQVIYLQKFHGLSFARATSAVIMDKLLEFLVNFLLLAVGAWAVFQVGLIPDNGSRPVGSLIGLGILLAWPLVHILLMYNGFLPLSALLRAQPFLSQKTKTLRLIFASERMAASFCQRHLPALLAAVGVSLLSVAGIVAEYVLMLKFLGVQLNGLQIFAALTALQLAFLMPLPGGLGALEASQVFALGVFGQPAAVAISLTLLMRARDILNGGLGLLLAGRVFGR